MTDEIRTPDSWDVPRPERPTPDPYEASTPASTPDWRITSVGHPAPTADAAEVPVTASTPPAPSPAPSAPAPRRSTGAVVVAAVLGGIVGGALVAAALWFGLLPQTTGNRAGSSSPTSVTRTAVTTRPVVAGLDSAGDTVVAAARKVTPSVVNVAVEQSGVNPFTGQRVIQQSGNGSGVILRQDGYILTNNHVVEGADKITVRIGTEDLPAKVIGADASTDLAVIKVERTGLTAAELGSSADLQVGQLVVAIGSPFGLDKTVTSGIVSALARSTYQETQTDLTAYTNLIQTDASINPGNSGGALADAEGRVVGINTLIQSPSGQVGTPQSAGIGFAIPIDFAREVADQLIKTGRVSHPYMGVSTLTVDRSVAQQYGLSVDAGALVQLVQPGSPAEKAGLKRDDIIVQIGDTKIVGFEDVFTAVRSKKVGDTLQVKVVRAGKELPLSVTLGSDAQQQTR